MQQISETFNLVGPTQIFLPQNNVPGFQRFLIAWLHMHTEYTFTNCIAQLYSCTLNSTYVKIHTELYTCTAVH